ncbi:hypothetical protein JQ604_17260 [Bradyrhizobium jicamae]|uniref:hypothetical protein n=1 Tax=Bradyrhizobium jicamae TaxID=280332 RepID=UPI001BA938DA|nr:hypothetical protein [Bradyrhizobium jicamae]MBR0753936.1 hypothetical protein [Bradyrhizobium jicamae]
MPTSVNSVANTIALLPAAPGGEWRRRADHQSDGLDAARVTLKRREIAAVPGGY